MQATQGCLHVKIALQDSLEGLAPEGKTPRAFSLQDQWDLSAGAPQDWGKQRLHSWRAHTRSHMHGTQHKAVPP